MMTDQQLVTNNFEEKLKVFTHAVHGELTSEADFIIANTEIPTDTFNTVLSKSPTIKNIAEIQSRLYYFSAKAYPYSVWLDVQHLTDDWKNLMRAYDLQEAERNVMMKLENTLHVDSRISHQLTITQVKNEADLLKYTAVFMSLFEGSSEKDALESYFKQFSLEALGGKVQLFIGCIDEKAISTGLLIESKDSYGIYDVMTKAMARGKGYGSEMFQFLLTQTKGHQKSVVLLASADGKNIYKRFGFKDIGEMVVFE